MPHDALATRIENALGYKSHTQAEKYSFYAVKTKYARYVIRLERLKLSETTAAAARKLKETTSQTELRPIMGLCNIFLRFYSKFSRVRAPLKKHTKRSAHVITITYRGL